LAIKKTCRSSLNDDLHSCGLPGSKSSFQKARQPQEQIAMSIQTQAVGSWIRKSIWIIFVLVFFLLLPLNVHSEDINEDMIKAAQRGNMATVKSCIEKGANVNAKLGDSGFTALMLAAGEGHTEMVELLLANGADANTADVGKNTVLMKAAMNGYTKTVKALLAHGAQVNARGERGFTALMWAAQYGYADTIKVLLSKGAQVNMKSDLGDTALSRATDNGHTEIVRILKDVGAKE
jgi:ankyrin repeat protein